MDDQLFTFLFAFVVFAAGVVISYTLAGEGVKRVEEVCAEYDALNK